VTGQAREQAAASRAQSLPDSSLAATLTPVRGQDPPPTRQIGRDPAWFGVRHGKADHALGPLVAQLVREAPSKSMSSMLNDPFALSLPLPFLVLKTLPLIPKTGPQAGFARRKWLCEAIWGRPAASLENR
jgi:hypothetical protein